MARIKRIFFNGELTYPMSITDAIIDTDTNKTLTARLREMETSVVTGTAPIDVEDVKKIINGEEISN